MTIIIIITTFILFTIFMKNMCNYFSDENKLSENVVRWEKKRKLERFKKQLKNK